MKPARPWVLAIFLAALTPASAFGDIHEYSDADGKVVYYKYTDRQGSVAFSDSLAAIPQEVRSRQRIVKMRVPGSKKTAVAPPPEAPATVPPPSLVFETPQPAEPVPEQRRSRWSVPALAVLGAAALLVLAAVLRRTFSGTGRRPGSRSAPAGRQERPPREAREPAARGGSAPKGPVDAPPSAERQQQLLDRYLQAKDFASAARLCESFGDLPRAAAYHREAGNLPRAQELYASLKDHRSAAEVAEALGEDLKAAELYEAAIAREVPDARSAPGGDSAARSGRLFEKAGDEARALSIYARAGLFAEAAPLYERRQEFRLAGESYLRAGNAAKAEECFRNAGDDAHGSALLADYYYEKGLVREAAGHAEKAGDFVRAAEMRQELGEYGKAGELYARAGFFDDAAENFVLANDRAGAAAAFEQAGKHLQAAQALEGLGAEPARVADLFEKGGDFHAAGRLFIKAGDFARALSALQRVDPASENARSASLLIGMIFLRTGKVGLAQEKFLKIIDSQPIGKQTLDAYYFLALCHESAGDAAKARGILEKILVEDYNFRDVRRRLEKMGGARL